MVTGLCHFVLSFFFFFFFYYAVKRRHPKRLKLRHVQGRKDEITTCEKTKTRNLPGKKAKFQREETKKQTNKKKKKTCEKTPFET